MTFFLLVPWGLVHYLFRKETLENSMYWLIIPTSRWYSRHSIHIIVRQNSDKSLEVGGWTNPFEKYARQIGNLPQIGVKIKNIWNHHAIYFWQRTSLSLCGWVQLFVGSLYSRRWRTSIFWAMLAFTKQNFGVKLVPRKLHLAPKKSSAWVI